jgi:hypothetical protein
MAGPPAPTSPIPASITKGKPSVAVTAPTQPPSGVQVPAEFEIQKGILILYLLIIGVLGMALGYSLSLGKDYVTFSSSIITAITTIAGFAVGANVTK